MGWGCLKCFNVFSLPVDDFGSLDAKLRHENKTLRVVILTFVHLPPALRAEPLQRLTRTLRPGGLLVLEAFHPRQLPFASGGPKDSEVLYTLEMLHADFAELLDEILAWEGEVVLDEGPGHQGPAYVKRWVEQAKAACNHDFH